MDGLCAEIALSAAAARAAGGGTERGTDGLATIFFGGGALRTRPRPFRLKSPGAARRRPRDDPRAPATVAGTPSLLPPAALRRVLDALRSAFGIAPGAEISMEMDPGTFDASLLDQFLQCGVTRVSLGIQSFSQRALSAAGRVPCVPF